MSESGFEKAQRRIQEALETGTDTLDLSRLGLKEIPEAIAKLSKLTALSLDSNQLKTLPEAIAFLEGTLDDLDIFGIHNPKKDKGFIQF